MDVDKSDHVELFRFWLTEGLKYRLKDSPEMKADLLKYKKRLRMEFDIICGIPGYVDYFLMVSDLVRWAKDNGILVGAGRGSAAGSLCCWFLRITEIDPLLYPMLFERFISVDRTDLPDIDIDFEDERRHEVVEYCQRKYGFDRVANILNFVRYKGKNSIDDIVRVYEIPEWKAESIKGKLVERSEGHPRFADTIEDTVEGFAEVKKLFESTPALKFASKLEGNYRNTSIHPAAVVIASVPLDHICATYTKESGADENRGSGVAFDKKDSEYLGLLKVDFLSLTTLTAVRACLENIGSFGMSIEEFYNIPLDDPLVYEAFRAGDVLGIFQFEGYSTRKVLKGVAPTKFMDLVDVNALSRPGGDDTAYIKAKQTGVLPKAIHPNVDKHIEWTYGTIVYQEQILLILRDLGNFGAAEVNAIRKIISAKQDSTVFNEYLIKFVEGAATHGVSEEDAKFVWQKMVNATGYAFNISHAVCYSDLAYRQMWLKVHHPEFYLGQLLKCPTDEKGLERRRKLIVEAERKNIQVKSVSLVYSKQNWSLVDKKLYAGFQAIKGIGPKQSENIVKWRDNVLELEEDRLLDWDDLNKVKGIGPGRVAVIREFAESDDPFGVLRTKRLLNEIREQFANGEFADLEAPTHRSIDIIEPDEWVIFMGVIRKRVYKDYVQQRLKYGGDGLTREDILSKMDEPDLLKYVTITAEDEYDEPIQIRVGRKKYPSFASLIGRAEIGVDVILVKGYSTDFGGMAIQASDVVIINP